MKWCPRENNFFSYQTTNLLRQTSARCTWLQPNGTKKRMVTIYNRNTQKKNQKHTNKASCPCPRKTKTTKNNQRLPRQANMLLHNSKTNTHATPHPKRLLPHLRPSCCCPSKPNKQTKQACS